MARLVEPNNEDEALVRKDLLPKVTDPRHAISVEDLGAAFAEWVTNKRMFVGADGVSFV